MNNILSQSFENLKEYQNQFTKKYKLTVIENNKFLKSSIKIQVSGNNIFLETDWEIMIMDRDYFFNFPDGFDFPPVYILGVDTLLANYQIIFNNISEELLASIEPKILIKSGLDGTGPTRPLSHFIKDDINSVDCIQYLEGSDTSEENKVLIIKSLHLQVDLIPPSNELFFPDGYGPLTPYYSKLILQLNNPEKFI